MGDYREQPQDYYRLKEPITEKVNTFVTMHVQDGVVSFKDMSGMNSIVMTEWEFAEAGLLHARKRFEEKTGRKI